MKKPKVILRGGAVNILYQHRTKMPIPLNLSANPATWQEKEGAWIKNDRVKNITITARLNEIVDYCDRYFMEHKDYPVPASMKGFFNPKPKPFAEMNFHEIWIEFIKSKTQKGKDSISDGRLKHYNNFYNTLVAFHPTVQVSDFCDELYLKLKDYYDKVQGYATNTEAAHIRGLNAFINWYNDYIKRKHEKMAPIPLITNVSSKFYRRDIIYHPIDELRGMLGLNLDCEPELAESRDRYCLQCFTGLRYSDVFSDKWQIQGDFLRKLPKKTQKFEDAIVVPLRTEAKMLIERIRQRGFRSINSVDYNQHLKVIGDRAGINQPYTMVKGRRGFKAGMTYSKSLLMCSSVARSTFICQMIELDVQEYKIMKMTGIKDTATLRHYAEVVDQTLLNTMREVERKQAAA